MQHTVYNLGQWSPWDMQNVSEAAAFTAEGSSGLVLASLISCLHVSRAGPGVWRAVCTLWVCWVGCFPSRLASMAPG